MNIRFLLVSTLAALFVSGCGQKDPNATSASGSSAAPASASTPVPAKAAGPRVIEITANDAMKFNLATIEATAGEQLKIVLTNVGNMPKEAMGHNLVLLKAGTDAAAYAAAAMGAKDTDYLPPALKDQVIGATKLLGPRKSDEFTFTVPAAGQYTFLCSFPAHFVVGMKGTLIVK